jgi:hypothetical protein
VKCIRGKRFSSQQLCLQEHRISGSMIAARAAASSGHEMAPYFQAAQLCFACALAAAQSASRFRQRMMPRRVHPLEPNLSTRSLGGVPFMEYACILSFVPLRL